MEELFNNILVLVPVALLIFLRVFAEGARKRSEKTRKEAVASAPKKAQAAQKATPAAKQDLMGRLRRYLSGSLDQLMDKPEPLHFEEEAQKRLGHFKASNGNATPPKPGTALAPQHLLPGAMEESAAIVHEPPIRYVFPKQLERMSPLKRAIVLSEVLGKPKSLQ